MPPTDYWNGWACFVVSILMIGLLTAFIGDLASHFGCTIGLKDSVTAVVFVALGTSVPGKHHHGVCCEGPFPPRLGLGLGFGFWFGAGKAVLCRILMHRFEIYVDIGFQSQMGWKDRTRMWIRSCGNYLKDLPTAKTVKYLFLWAASMVSTFTVGIGF